MHIIDKKCVNLYVSRHPECRVERPDRVIATQNKINTINYLEVAPDTN